MKKSHKLRYTILFSLLLLFGYFVYWFAQRSISSGYWQIKSDIAHIKVPSDWKKITKSRNESSSLGVLGVKSCLDLDGSSKKVGFPCYPVQNIFYSLPSQPPELESLFKKIASDNGYVNQPKEGFECRNSPRYIYPKGNFTEKVCTYTSTKGVVSLFQQFTIKYDQTLEVELSFSGYDFSGNLKAFKERDRLY